MEEKNKFDAALFVDMYMGIFNEFLKQGFGINDALTHTKNLLTAILTGACQGNAQADGGNGKMDPKNGFYFFPKGLL